MCRGVVSVVSVCGASATRVVCRIARHALSRDSPPHRLHLPCPLSPTHLPATDVGVYVGKAVVPRGVVQQWGRVVCVSGGSSVGNVGQSVR